MIAALDDFMNSGGLQTTITVGSEAIKKKR